MKTPEDESSGMSVRTISADGKAPKRRVPSTTAAYSAYTTIRNANIRRDARFGDIQCIYNGWPPTNPSVLERNGTSDMPNLNTKQFTSKVGTYTATWTALAAQGDGYVEIQADHEDSMEAERRSKVMTEGMNRAIRMWDNPDYANGNQYILETAARDTQMGLFGIGMCFFTDPIDFRFRMIPTRRVLVPDGTRLCLDNCPAIFIEDTISVTDLYAKRKMPGWNEDAILKNLYDRVEMMTQSTHNGPTYAEWVNRLRDNDTQILSDFLPIRIVHMFVKEFDGTITQSTFTDLYLTTGTDAKTKTKYDKHDKDKYDRDGECFIYDKMKVGDRWQQIVIPFADNAGAECDYHGVKGFGDLIFDGCHLTNLMFNRAATAAIMRNTLMFKGNSEADIQKMDQIVITNFGIMASGLELEQQNFNADPESALQIVAVGNQMISENTRISPQNEKTTTGEQPTATQVNADRADRAQFTTLQIAIYRAVGLDVLFCEMHRRLSQPESKYPESWGGGKVAKWFREYCKDRGIPEEDLVKVKTVRANRNIGSGDMSLDLFKADQLMSVATPGKGQLNARREKVIALKGVEMVDAFIEPEPQPSPVDAQITSENDFIQLGQPPTAYGWQEQEKHVTGHLELLSQAAQATAEIQEQGINPQNLEGAKKLSNLLAAGIQHVEQHVQLMSEVPRTDKRPALHEQFIKETAKQLNNLQQLEQAISEDIQKADVQAQPQASPEMMKAQQEMQLRAAEHEQTMQFNAENHQQKLGNLAVTTAARTESATHKHMLQADMDAQRTQQELAKNDLATSQEMLTQHAKTQQELQANAALTAQKIADQKKLAESKPKPITKPNKKE